MKIRKLKKIQNKKGLNRLVSPSFLSLNFDRKLARETRFEEKLVKSLR